MNIAPPKVLLIDSDMSIPLAVSHVFRGAGPYFITAFNAGEALQKMENFSFDLFLLALDLKDLDSLQLLKIIDEKSPDAPVILMANNDSDYCQLNSRIDVTKKQGRCQVIEKPFHLDSLTVLIERCFYEWDLANGVKSAAESENHERRNHLRNSQMQAVHLIIEAAEKGYQQLKSVQATLTDISDGGLGLITKYRLERSQPVTIASSSIGKQGVVAWTTSMDNHVYRAGIQFC